MPSYALISSSSLAISGEISPIGVDISGVTWSAFSRFWFATASTLPSGLSSPDKLLNLGLPGSSSFPSCGSFKTISFLVIFI